MITENGNDLRIKLRLLRLCCFDLHYSQKREVEIGKIANIGYKIGFKMVSDS